MLRSFERPFRLEFMFLPGAHDARGSAVTLKSARDLGITLESVESRDIYLIDCALTPDELSLITEAFVDPVVQSVDPGTASPESSTESFSWAIEVGLKPGVTDNVGTSARVAIGDLLGRTLSEEEDVFTSILYLLRGSIDRGEAGRIATDLLANPLINSISLHSFEEWSSQPRDITPPRITSGVEPVVEIHNLDRPDDELIQMSRTGLWALTIEEMRAIREHFSDEERSRKRSEFGLGPSPTDVEMETLAQTWSEHCKHKIFNSTIEYEDAEEGETLSIRSLFDSYIRGTTRKVEPEIDWLLSVFTDNAGVVAFTEETNLVFKAETHNTPSALDPYGGAMTGIVGVNRDPFGTGRGADLLINTWGYCFASPFHDGEIPEGLMHPRRIRDGVHQGVIDGGNQSGIPYGRGWELFDERYLGKPLVYCGTVGIMPATLPDGSVSHEKITETGDVIVMVGGRIGADGIHGATFSSQELHEESPSQAVQIGDPITQKKMTDFLLEALDMGLERWLRQQAARRSIWPKRS